MNLVNLIINVATFITIWHLPKKRFGLARACFVPISAVEQTENKVRQGQAKVSNSLHAQRHHATRT